jgi:hypothetical protein
MKCSNLWVFKTVKTPFYFLFAALLAFFRCSFRRFLTPVKKRTKNLAQALNPEQPIYQLTGCCPIETFSGCEYEQTDIKHLVCVHWQHLPQSFCPGTFYKADASRTA